MIRASVCAEEPDIRDELRFFGAVSAWELEFVVGDSYCCFLKLSNSFSSRPISLSNFRFSSCRSLYI